jgi:hypothetical protein
MMGRVDNFNENQKRCICRTSLSKMRAMYLERRTGPEGLTLGEIPKPSPKEGEVLVKVQATSVMPTEFGWYPTFNTIAGEPRPFPIVLSHELSGEVETEYAISMSFSTALEAIL